MRKLSSTCSAFSVLFWGAGTSAVSIDQERKLYEAAASLDISCVTISQRLSLPEFHSQEIKLGQPTADGFRLQPIAKVESE